MSLKVFVSPISFRFATGDDQMSVDGCPVYDSTTGTVYEFNPGSPVYLGATFTVVYSDTLGTLRNKMMAGLRDNFELATGRTDGESLIFVWLDDKGIL